MIAIIHNGAYVVGYHNDPNLKEFDELGTQYDLLEEVPEIILKTPMGYYVKRIALGEYALEILSPPGSLPEERITQLEKENALLALELVQTQIRLDEVEQEQADLLLLLVSEEVI